jgi:hypothetical protein
MLTTNLRTATEGWDAPSCAKKVQVIGDCDDAQSRTTQINSLWLKNAGCILDESEIEGYCLSDQL